MLQCISSCGKKNWEIKWNGFVQNWFFLCCVFIPSKYPVSVGFSGFGMKGGITDSKFSQSMDSKNSILWTSLAVGRSFGSVVKNISTAVTASSDNASSSCGHSMSRKIIIINKQKTKKFQNETAKNCERDTLNGSGCDTHFDLKYFQKLFAVFHHWMEVCRS